MFEDATLFSICLTAINSERSQWICKHGKNWYRLNEDVRAAKTNIVVVDQMKWPRQK